MKNMRHVVNVMRPTKAVGTLGESQGIPECVMANVPCAINTLSGSEPDQARRGSPFATAEIQLYGNPANPLDETCYLEMASGRTFHIQAIKDKNLNGIELTLLCGENK